MNMEHNFILKLFKYEVAPARPIPYFVLFQEEVHSDTMVALLNTCKYSSSTNDVGEPIKSTIEQETTLLREAGILRRDRQSLKHQLHVTQEEMHTLVANYQQKLDNKNKEVRYLKAQLAKQGMETERKAKSDTCELERKILDMRKSSHSIDNSSKKKLRQAERQIDEFRKDREKSQAANREIQYLKDANEQERLDHQRQELFLKKKKDVKAQELRNNAPNVVSEDMSALMTEIVSDNKSITNELRSQLQLIHELSAENSCSKNLLSRIYRELDLKKGAEKEHTRLSLSQKAEIKRLEKTVTLLNKEVSEMRLAYDQSVLVIKAEHDKNVQDALQGAIRLKKKLSVKVCELSLIKELTERIIKERGEVEEFLLDTLSLVKDAATAEKTQLNTEVSLKSHNKINVFFATF